VRPTALDEIFDGNRMDRVWGGSKDYVLYGGSGANEVLADKLDRLYGCERVGQ
jgi:hypothetical protein